MGDGIYVSSSDNNIFRDNTIEDNTGRGIYLEDSDNNTISNNLLEINGADTLSL